MAILLVVLVLSGCAASDMKRGATALWNNEVFKLKDEQEPKEPKRIVGIWSDSVLYNPDRPATRGFGGRIFFYNEKHRAVEVDGELVVYAYDDDNPHDHDQEPDRKYVFPAEKFAEHLSPSEFGPSYSVWIPWDAVGGEQKEISLLPVFKPAVGQTVAGENTRNLLPGKIVGEPPRQQSAPHFSGRTAADGATPAAGRLVHYEQPTWQDESDSQTAQTLPSDPAELHRRQRLRSTTIAVPDSLKKHLARPQQATAEPSNATAAEKYPLGMRPLDANGGSAATPNPAPAEASLESQSVDRFGRPRYRVLGAPIARPVRDRARWERYQTAAPLPHELPPRSASPTAPAQSGPSGW